MSHIPFSTSTLVFFPSIHSLTLPLLPTNFLFNLSFQFDLFAFYSFVRRIDLILVVDPWAHLPNQATAYHTVSFLHFSSSSVLSSSSSSSSPFFSMYIFSFQFQFPIRHVILCCFFIARRVCFLYESYVYTNTHRVYASIILFALCCLPFAQQYSFYEYLFLFI